MTAKQLKDARRRLGLSARGLADALDMSGEWSDRTVRRWEDGAPIPGPVAIAVRFLVLCHDSGVAPSDVHRVRA